MFILHMEYSLRGTSSHCPPGETTESYLHGFRHISSQGLSVAVDVSDSVWVLATVEDLERYWGCISRADRSVRRAPFATAVLICLTACRSPGLDASNNGSAITKDDSRTKIGLFMLGKGGVSLVVEWVLWAAVNRGRCVLYCNVQRDTVCSIPGPEGLDEGCAVKP